MDTLDFAILTLRLALVLALYLFLFAVLRTTARSLVAANGAPRARPAPSAAGGGVLRVVVVEPAASGWQLGQAVALSEGVTIGRSAAGADVAVADPTVSSRHARIGRSGRQWTIEDLGSTNGTSVNGEPVPGRATIAPGDIVALGNVRLEVEP